MKENHFIINFLKITSILLAIVGATFIIPLSVAFVYKETSMYLSFLIPMILSFVFCFAVNFPTRHTSFSMSTKQTYLIVAMAWVVATFLGSVPLYFSHCFSSYADALFESFSGFSTTGATVLSQVEQLPRSVNVWRCLTHWIGGMGIVTLTVALMPLLGVGGFQLIKAETTGPEKGKVTARITTTAKLLWTIYISFTVLEIIALRLAGMDFVDAMAHSFATLGTGGFSTRNASIGSYNSLSIDIIVTIFLVTAFLLAAAVVTKDYYSLYFLGMFIPAIIYLFSFQKTEKFNGIYENGIIYSEIIFWKNISSYEKVNQRMINIQKTDNTNIQIKSKENLPQIIEELEKNINHNLQN